MRSWSVRRAAVLVAALTVGSTVLGFLRDVVIGAVFGAGPSLDAYLVAQGVMNIVLGLISGAMARSLTPVIARQANECSSAGSCAGHRTIDVAVTVTLVVLGVVGLVMAIFTAPVVGLLAPGFGPEQTELTVLLTRVVLIATVLVSGTNLLAGVAHAHGRFGWAGAQGIPFNIIMIISAAVFGPQFGVAALAVGFVVGSLARLLLQVVPLRSLGLKVTPSLALRDPGFREITRMLPPLLLSSAITNVNQLVDRGVASTVGDGAITALSYGWHVVNLPETVIVASLLVPLYPAIGAAGDDRIELRRLIRRGLQAILTALAPIAAVLVVVAQPIVATLFGYGAFDGDAVDATATALRWYGAGLVALGVSTLFVRASHAVGDTVRPVITAVIAMAVNVLGNLWLGPLWGIRGIALATTASLVVAAVLNGWFLIRHHDAFDFPDLVKVSGRVLLGITAAIGVGSAINAIVPDWWSPLRGFAVSVPMLLVFLGVLRVIRAPELGLLGELVGRRGTPERG